MFRVRILTLMESRLLVMNRGRGEGLETSSEALLRQCLAALRDGLDFPSIWHEVIKGHPLVITVPVQRLVGDGTSLEVRLVTGQRLIYDSGARQFSLG